jgi:hypothetical protein
MDFFVVINKKRLGPFNKDELKKLDINGDTLVWYEALDDWEKIKNVKPLNDELTLPPPIKIKRVNTIKLLKSKSAVFIIIWAIPFLMLYLLTYIPSDKVQHSDRPESNLENFWPFFTKFYSDPNECSRPYSFSYNKNECFNGFLAGYDFSEVIVYILVPVIIMLIFENYKKSLFDISNGS